MATAQTPLTLRAAVTAPVTVIVWGALLGALVIVSISNGMDLLSLDTSIKFMVTGGVLLAAVSADAVTRTRRQAAGRA